MIFRQALDYGKVGEGKIAEWLRRRGWSVLPVYEVEEDTGKGPRLLSPTREIIAPDMFVFKANEAYWIEAKHKSAFSWHRLTSRWVTGIDIRHYEDYCTIEDYSPWPVWLIFFHEGGQAKDSPPNSPKGIFGNKLDYLRGHENHRSMKWGRWGMVYWSIESLLKLD